MTNINSSSAIFSHNTEEWETPQELFDELNKEFHFGIDVCATHENAKCENFFSKKDDGLKQNWGGARNYLVQSPIWKRHQMVGAKSI